MNLPTPNAEETTEFIRLYEEKTGVTLSRADAFDSLSRLVRYLYLTQYEHVRPLRPQEPYGSLEAWRDARLTRLAARKEVSRRKVGAVKKPDTLSAK